jgi:AMMECR1 domain-containing protein
LEFSDDMVRRHGAQMNEVVRCAIRAIGASRALEGLPAAFSRPGASFVTLHKAGRLRGCCGSALARRGFVARRCVVARRQPSYSIMRRG